MVDDVISNFLCLSVKRHDRFLKNISLFFDTFLLTIHLTLFILSLGNGILEHNELLIKSLSLIVDIHLYFLQKIFVVLHLLKHIGEILNCLELFSGFISDTRDLRLNLEDIILLLLYEFLNSLESLISLLHSKQGFLPIIKKSLL